MSDLDDLDQSENVLQKRQCQRIIKYNYCYVHDFDNYFYYFELNCWDFYFRKYILISKWTVIDGSGRPSWRTMSETGRTKRLKVKGPWKWRILQSESGRSLQESHIASKIVTVWKSRNCQELFVNRIFEMFDCQKHKLNMLLKKCFSGLYHVWTIDKNHENVSRMFFSPNVHSSTCLLTET